MSASVEIAGECRRASTRPSTTTTGDFSPLSMRLIGRMLWRTAIWRLAIDDNSLATLCVSGLQTSRRVNDATFRIVVRMRLLRAATTRIVCLRCRHASSSLQISRIWAIGDLRALDQLMPSDTAARRRSSTTRDVDWDARAFTRLSRRRRRRPTRAQGAVSASPPARRLFKSALFLAARRRASGATTSDSVKRIV